uniref:EGF-like domain-containing protein n=1 Tax=Romanomermis culicivorax TaxID=13658 RepID=A0A915L227_ROMCU
MYAKWYFFDAIFCCILLHHSALFAIRCKKSSKNGAFTITAKELCLKRCRTFLFVLKFRKIFACDQGTFGLECKQKCRPCRNNGSCSVVDGLCSCSAGYSGFLCERSCPVGFCSKSSAY